jgi:hypothetical protein
MWVVASFDGLTSPTTMSPYFLTISALRLCRKSFRLFAIFAWMLRIRFGVFLARCVVASFYSLLR